MTDTPLAAPVAVVLERDVPVRLVWKDTRFFVDAPPTPMGRTVPTLAGERPLTALVTGWRLRATSARGESHTFDIMNCGHATWRISALHD